MSGDFAAKFIWACAFLFVYSLAGEIFLFKIVKMKKFATKKFATIIWPIKTKIHFNLCFISKYISIRSNRRWLLIIWAISISRCSFNFMSLQQGNLYNLQQQILHGISKSSSLGVLQNSQESNCVGVSF